MDTAEFRELLMLRFGGAHLALASIIRQVVPSDPWAHVDPHSQITHSGWRGQTMALPIYRR